MKTTILFASLTGLLVLVGNAPGGTGSMDIASGFALLMNIGAWWFGDTVALTMRRARLLPAGEAPAYVQS